jgi:hypothetical protein
LRPVAGYIRCARVVMVFRLIAIAFVLAAGCSKARPADQVDAGGGDDDPDARETIDAADEPDAPPHIDADPSEPDAPVGPPDANTTPDAAPPPPDAMPPPVTVTLTQTTDSTTILTEPEGPGSTFSVACANEFGVTAANSYYRAFTLAEHGVVGPLTISQVSIAVETAFDEPPPPNTPAAVQPATVRLHTYAGAVLDNLDLAQATQIASVPVSIAHNTTQTVLNFAVSGTIPANGTFLVELAIPDGDPDNDTYGPHFYIGANNLGQTKGGYVLAAECSIASPTTFAAVGFPDRNIIITATGTYQP